MSGNNRKTDDHWREVLTQEEFHVCRRKGTERAFTGAYWNDKTPGTYVCTCCGAPLFGSNAKYDSGTGWPSYREPVSPDAISRVPDDTLFMRRTEVVCAACDSHLGHVFDDGPAPTGQRYCINSVSLKLIPDGENDSEKQ